MSTVTWNGGSTNNDWSNAANWGGGVVPNYYDSVVFTDGASVYLDAAETFEGITVSGSVTISSNGQTLTNMGSGAFNLAASAVLTLVDVSFNTQTSSSTDGTIVLAGSTLTIPNGDAFAGTVEFSDVTNKNNVLNITEYGSSGTFPARILNLGAGDEIVISGGSPTGGIEEPLIGSFFACCLLVC